MKLFTLTRDATGMAHVLVTEGHRAWVLGAERSLKVRKHSPTGFEWGYMGSGPSQLALAILLEVTEEAAVSEQIYQDFKAEVIAKVPSDGGTISEGEVRLWLKGASARPPFTKEAPAC